VSDNRLGKGLEALIRPNVGKKEKVLSKKKSNSKDIISKVSLKNIRPNPNQPRQDFNEISIIELQASIKEKGIITPVTVRKTDKGYELVAGERRYRAAKNLRLRTIPAYIIKVKDDSEMMEMALIENIQRENLNPIEESQALSVLNQKHGLSHKEISKSIGKSRTSVTNSLRLLKLPIEILESLRSYEISSGHGRALLQLDSQNAQIRMWKRIIKYSLSVRDVEALVKSFEGKHKKRYVKKTKNKSHQISSIENQLIEKLGTKVRVQNGKKGGTIEISYFSDEDLNRILEIFDLLSV
tara:strand:- start:1595 stop:2485 length:891 start_codon:yes stop_codon:yes gene_type:complete